MPDTNALYYPGAPLTEAVLDIKATLPDAVTLEDLRRLPPGWEARFTRIDTNEKAFKISFENGQATLQEAGTAGKHVFRCDSEQKLIQFGMGSFTLNKLRPYDRWETFRDEARDLWAFYRSVARPTSVYRIALRYINEILVPLDHAPEEFPVVTLPNIPAGFNTEIVSFHTRSVLKVSDRNAHVVLNTMTRPLPSTATVVTVVLDIDVFEVGEFSPEGGEIWDHFETLRHLKNEVFTKSVAEEWRNANYS